MRHQKGRHHRASIPSPSCPGQAMTESPSGNGEATTRNREARSAITTPLLVMAGRGDEASLRADVPAIHVLFRMRGTKDVDARQRRHLRRTAKSCGSDAPTLASSWREYFR